MSAEFGLYFTTGESLKFLRGRKVSVWIEELSSTSGRKLPSSFEADFRRRCAEAFLTHLNPIPHVKDVIDQLRVPFCVASSAPRQKIDLNLKLTGLSHYFEDRIFSGYEIGSWKPDPGIFQHASKVMGFDPDRCLVIEDSVAGVAAAKAAGMNVFGYETDCQPPLLQIAGACTFRSMTELPALIDSWLNERTTSSTSPNCIH